MRALVLARHLDLPEAHLLVGLKQAGVDLEVMAEPERRFAEIVEALGIPFAPIRFRSRLDPRAYCTIRERLCDGRYDLVHYSDNRALSNGLLAAHGLPLKHLAYRGTTGHLSRWDPASWLTYLHPRLDRIVCVSEAVRRYLLGLRVPAAKLITIYKGHDPSWYEQGIPPDRASFGFSAEHFLVGCTATMRRVKGIHVLLQAALELPVRTRARFLLVGEIVDARLRRLAQHPRIRSLCRFTGPRNDATACMRACDAFVMPSLEREGLPKALIEAMAQCVPPIVTNVGGMPEVVEHGECGLVVPPGNAHALAEAIQSLAEDPVLRHRFAVRARQRIRLHFNIEETIRRYRSLYHELAPSPRDHRCD